MAGSTENRDPQAAESNLVRLPTPNGAEVEFENLATCPAHFRPRYDKMAARAAGGSRSAAIRLKCLECCAWQSAEVKRCQIRSCALWKWRG